MNKKLKAILLSILIAIIFYINISIIDIMNGHELVLSDNVLVTVKQDPNIDLTHSKLTELEGLLDKQTDSLVELIYYMENLPFEPIVSLDRVDGGIVNYSPEDVTKPSNISAEVLNSHLEDTPLKNLGETFVKAEKLYSVNALFLCSLAVHESAWGKSKLAREKNNLFGFKAYNKSPFKSGYKFDSLEDSIIHVAGYVSHNYLLTDGRYHRGTSVDNINTLYAVLDDGSPNREWSANIKKLMKKLSKEAN